MKALILSLAIALSLVFIPPAKAQTSTDTDTQAILTVIADMEMAWNKGDFKGYMAGFKNPDVVFVSGGRFQSDWQGTLDHYVRDYGTSPETRGTLHFYDMKVEILGPDSAQLIGRFHLERPQHALEGINTRLFRKVDGHWVIALNHVSAYDVPSAN